MLICGGHERSQQNQATVQELDYEGRALTSLTRKLENPRSIDEGDLFCAAILAQWSLKTGDREKFDRHAGGVLAIMKFLSEKEKNRAFSSVFRTLWPLVRDQITTAAEFRHYGTLRGLGRSFQSVEGLYRDFRLILGPKTIEQRYHFCDQIHQSKPNDPPLHLVHRMAALGLQRMETSLEVFLASISRTRLSSDILSPYIESSLVDCFADIHLFSDQQLAFEIERFLTELQEKDVALVEASIPQLIRFLEATLARRLRLLMLLILKQTCELALHNFPERHYDLGSILRRLILFIENCVRRKEKMRKFGN